MVDCAMANRFRGVLFGNVMFGCIIHFNSLW